MRVCGGEGGLEVIGTRCCMLHHSRGGHSDRKGINSPCCDLKSETSCTLVS